MDVMQHEESEEEQRYKTQSYVAKLHNVRIIPNDNSLRLFQHPTRLFQHATRLFQQTVSAKSLYQNHCL